MAEDKKKVSEPVEQKPAEAAVAEQQPAVAVSAETFVHSLRFHLVGGQQFTLNELTNSAEMPQNVLAFINAWREMRDVWHSPNNDAHFGVRVRDVSLYEYQVARAVPKAAEGEEAAEPAKKEEK